MHVGDGSPFGGLLASGRKVASGREAQLDEYFAKITYSLNSICQKVHPFRHVFLFTGMKFLVFPANGANRFSFPVPKTDVLVLGAAASDSFLDWRNKRKSITEHPMIASDPTRPAPTAINDRQ